MRLSRAFNNLGHVGVVHVIRTVLSLVIGIQMIKHLGPEAYGKLSVAIAIVGILGVTMGIAPETIIVRQLARGSIRDGAAVIRTALAIKLAAAALHVVLAIAAIAVLRYGAEINAAVAMIAMGSFGTAFAVTGTALMLDSRFDTLSLISLAGALIGVVVRLALLQTDAGLLWFAAAMLLDAVVLAIINLYFYSQVRRLLECQPLDKDVARALVVQSWPIALAGLMVALYTRTDVLCITHYLGEQAAGVYSVAIRLTECWYFIPSALAAVAYPDLVKHRIEAPDRFYDLLTMSCGAGFWTAVAMALGITFTGPLVLPWLLGPAFVSSIPTLQITSWVLIILPLSAATLSWLLIDAMPRVTLYASFGTALVNLVANVILVPSLGISGAAIALLLSHTAYLGLSLWIVRDVRATAAILKGMSPVTLARLIRLCMVAVRGSRAA